ncbi:MAG: hypothetical protein NNA18_10165 [Nitrospira sp.]|nr:hypothetical protein [Nitrospira sp.]
MTQKRSLESEEARLKKKIAEQRAAGVGKHEAAFRSLRKRLKRVQRKRRVLAFRRKQATSRKGADATATA